MSFSWLFWLSFIWYDCRVVILKLEKLKWSQLRSILSFPDQFIWVDSIIWACFSTPKMKLEKLSNKFCVAFCMIFENNQNLYHVFWKAFNYFRSIFRKLCLFKCRLSFEVLKIDFDIVFFDKRTCTWHYQNTFDFFIYIININWKTKFQDIECYFRCFTKIIEKVKRISIVTVNCVWL